MGWGSPDDKEAIELGLKNTLYSICIEHEEKTIGYGRVVGDGGFTFISKILSCYLPIRG